jgi:hypothetical protein
MSAYNKFVHTFINAWQIMSGGNVPIQNEGLSNVN